MHRIITLIVLFYTSSLYAQKNDYVLISETDELVEYYRPNYPYEQDRFHYFLGPIPLTSETGVLDGVF